MTTLRRVQLTELKILSEIANLCDKHNIAYFLLEGTLLGAIRHQGFIPWDDDVDIGMMREDYDKFLSLCQAELDGRFAVQYHENESNYHVPFAKVRLKNTVYIEHETSEQLNEKGFWVDIFPLDRIGDPSGFASKLRGFTCKKLFSMSVILSKGGFGGAQKIAFTILKLFHVRAHTLVRLHTRIACRGKGKYIVNHGSAYGYRRQTVPADWYFPPRKAEFEGCMFTVPNKSEMLLERIYGEYMQLPPEEKRVPRHAALKIRFEDGSTAESLND